MAVKTIAHALFSWTENGEARIATHGESVEIDDDVIARYEKFGVFESEYTDPFGDAAPAVPVDPFAVTPAEPEVPKSSATKPVWEAYASARGIDTTTDMDKSDIIAAVERLDSGEN